MMFGVQPRGGRDGIENAPVTPAEVAALFDRAGRARERARATTGGTRTGQAEGAGPTDAPLADVILLDAARLRRRVRRRGGAASSG
jgi:hypothetical protein